MIDIEPPSLDEQTGVRVKHGNPIEYGLIVLITIAMVLLPVAQMLVRRIADVGIPLERKLTLWLGFLGALGATAAGKHLGLATTNFFKDGRRKKAAILFGDVASAVSCMLLAFGSYQAVKLNAVSETPIFWIVKDWWPTVIVPITFGLMTVRFIWRTPGKWRGRAVALAACAICALVFWKLDTHLSTGAPVIAMSVVIVIAFLLGTPLFAAMGALAMLLFFTNDSVISAVPQATMQLAENETLPAIPLLTLAGYVLAAGGASQRLVRAYKSLFGWMPGGLSIMVICVCAVFTTFTGGSGVTILALGGLLYPALVKDQYPDGFSLGLVTASGSLGLLFPPSLPVILYGAVAGVSADKLFLGGFVPGVLMLLVVIGYAVFIGIRANAPRQKFDLKEVGSALWAAKWDLGLPVVVLGVFLTGKGLVVEASALGALYALAVELIIFRDVHPLKEMPRVMAQSATLVGSVVVLMGVALGLTAALVDRQIPDHLVDWVQAHFHSQWTFLLALNGLLLVLGSVFEIYAAIIVLAPLVVPLGVAFNIEPVHLGVVFLANLELGFLFPPMGLNLFLSASRFNRPLPQLYKQALPFLIILALGVLVITYVPAMTTGVVALFARH